MTLTDAIYQAALKQAREHQKAHPNYLSVGTYGSFTRDVFPTLQDVIDKNAYGKPERPSVTAQFDELRRGPERIL
jgi:hypothetical protein